MFRHSTTAQAAGFLRRNVLMMGPSVPGGESPPSASSMPPQDPQEGLEAVSPQRPSARTLVEQMDAPPAHIDVSPMSPATVQYDETVPYTEEDRLIDLVESTRRDKIAAHNKTIPDPIHPSALIPQYRRVKKRSRLYRFDEVFPMISRKELTVPLPAPKQHPWVIGQPIGPHIVHGDGQQRIVGHNEVGFDEDRRASDWPKNWRGFQHLTSVGLTPSSLHGKVHADTVVKHSLQLSGKGIFATKAIKKGEHIMVVKSQAINLGFNSEIDRLCEMTTRILLNAYRGGPEEKQYLHQWVLTGQMSNIIERWPADATTKVLEDLGEPGVLEALELHPMHVGRIAAIIDMNGFLVESYYAERKGMGYWPEPALFNHSCLPNCDYDIIPQHKFAESEYCPKEEDATTGDYEDMQPQMQQQAGKKGAASSLMTMERETLAELEADLVENPTYLFCVKASRDISQGEELLISYVPTDWRFDDRQYVLHDRYRFWCKCPKCAVSLDYKMGFVNRVILIIILTYAFLQLFLFYAKESTTGRWEQAVANANSIEPWRPVDAHRYVN